MSAKSIAHYTKVQLIEAGYKALLDDAAEHNLSLGN